MRLKIPAGSSLNAISEITAIVTVTRAQDDAQEATFDDKSVPSS